METDHMKFEEKKGPGDVIAGAPKEPIEGFYIPAVATSKWGSRLFVWSSSGRAVRS
jgi:hypothetical protein